jgi:hypothetical protein
MREGRGAIILFTGSRSAAPGGLTPTRRGFAKGEPLSFEIVTTIIHLSETGIAIEGEGA